MKSLATFSWRLLALIVCLTPAFGDELADRLAAVPNPREADRTWVADPAGVVTSRKAEINQLIAALEQKTSVEIAVVVLPTIGSLVPKDFAVALVEKWGVGKRDKDNGVLVLHVLDQRRIEIETGYGMEGILPDVKCHWITEEIAVPFFKKNSFADGHFEVVRALIRGIEQPDISHSALISPWITQPGDMADRDPGQPRDSTALRFARTPERMRSNGWTPIALLVLGGGIYLLSTLSYLSRSRGKEPRDKYSLYKSAGTRLQYAATLPAAGAACAAEYAHNGTFFFAAPALIGVFLLTFWRRRRVLKELREAPRTCECGQVMRRLDEHDDDAYIKRGNVEEERISSMDYDVWVCSCGKSRVEEYEGKSPAEKCPKCTYRTFKVTSTRVLRHATTSSTGLRERTHACSNCGFSHTETSTIPMVVASSSSGSRSGGSSGRSGGSFGGGRSGGGGAGSSY